MPSQFALVGAWLKSQGQPGSQLQFLNQSPSSSQSMSRLLSISYLIIDGFASCMPLGPLIPPRPGSHDGFTRARRARAASPTVSTPLARRAQNASANFSTAIATETTTIHVTFITPSASITSISIQQQPTQYTPCLPPITNAHR